MTDPQPANDRPSPPGTTSEDLLVTGSSPAVVRTALGGEHAYDALQRPLDRLARSRSPQTLALSGLVIGLLLVVVVLFLQFVLSPETAISIGIVIVVFLGAGGLAARGVGELRDSVHWKAAGCFLCACAYLATASVALVNGVPLVFTR
ncbi:MAG TPA: hypothetical protein VFP34_05030 [Microlunatus sp.]|nr:hypothetical protein [Microlunatus sp.]